MFKGVCMMCQCVCVCVCPCVGVDDIKQIYQVRPISLEAIKWNNKNGIKYTSGIIYYLKG